MTNRRYRMRDGKICVVQNEYQRVTCLSCGEQQFCRLTHIWRYDAPNIIRPEYHTNYGQDLHKLKELLITYIDSASVRESIIEGKWALVMEDEIIGEEI